MSLSLSTMAMLRYGYGFRPGEKPAETADDLIAQIAVGTAQSPLSPLGGVAERRRRIIETEAMLRKARRTASKDEVSTLQAKVRRASLRMWVQDSAARFVQTVTSPLGFYERLVFFWSDHFSVSANKNNLLRQLVMVYEAEAIRPNVGGPFAELLRAAIQHPAMLRYLDQSVSYGPTSPVGVKKKKGLNENLARELLELHTLGANSGYTQTDVRNAALVLTGTVISQKRMEMDFSSKFAEPGTHEVLGVAYGDDGRGPGDMLQLIQNLARHPKTADHICRKLVVHFISDDPPSDLVQAMTDTWQRTEGDLTAVYSTMLAHPAAWRNEGTKARQPFDFMIAGLRALDGNGDVERFFLSMTGPSTFSFEGEDGAVRRSRYRAGRMLGSLALKRMGQPLWQPPSPAGFEEGFSAWVTGGQLAERLSWARTAVARFGTDRDPREFLKATLADAARDDTIRVVSQAPDQATGMMLVLASPEFNRR
ncbi:DUF1800 domain-containing protein [Pararhizobium arenae]|uniref:DUF1800 domain-containing protein n=1 Tax=Pararhizobium arenae TaxID=1856850 RepID=UPI00094AB377|nr:DUF1800 domain-containing protein [Pararhizobium arenae]